MEADAGSRECVAHECVEHEVEAGYNPHPEEETNIMPIEELLLSKYGRPSLDEIFRLAEKAEKKCDAVEPGSQEDNRRLADIVTRQKEFLRQAND
jgi:hypothetical protein